MQYNNFHYWIIAEIVAHITKAPYTEYVKSYILDPVGMTSSTYNHTEASTTGRLSGSFVRAEKNSTKCSEIWAEQDKLDRSCYGQPFETSLFTTGNGLFMAGPGGLVSSTNDVVRLDSSIFHVMTDDAAQVAQGVAGSKRSILQSDRRNPQDLHPGFWRHGRV